MAEKPDIAKLLDKMIPIVFEAQLVSFSDLPDILLMRNIDLPENEKAELQQAANKEKKVSVALIIFDDNS